MGRRQRQRIHSGLIYLMKFTKIVDMAGVAGLNTYMIQQAT
jgi:hypothetical protein